MQLIKGLNKKIRIRKSFSPITFPKAHQLGSLQRFYCDQVKNEIENIDFTGSVTPEKVKRIIDIDLSHISVFDMFSIGVGPSSSHTVGPMKAASHYSQELVRTKKIDQVFRIKTVLYGSLALTGEGHHTPQAILMGLEGFLPHNVDPYNINPRVAEIRTQNKLNLAGQKMIVFHNSDLELRKQERLPFHSNGIQFSCFDKNDTLIESYCYYSIGGGFFLSQDEVLGRKDVRINGAELNPIFPYHTASELLQLTSRNDCSISDLQIQNELTYGRSRQQIDDDLWSIWAIMDQCITRGISSKEIYLPGALRVKRRAPNIYRSLLNQHDPLHQSKESEKRMEKVMIAGEVLDWISMYSIAVNEENAAGGRVVTAPTNGAAGVIPAVLKFYLTWADPNCDQKKTVSQFLLTAGTIGALFKKGASISAAEVGCQGEIGVASSMAAAALCALYGGSPRQIASAAEIAMEHHLGMTCDPIGGLVQIPCIERNTMGSIKAINSARLAMLGSDQTSLVSLDDVIYTMLKTGLDMSNTYKETSLAGLAMNNAQIPASNPAC
jgi:L-serine dehydratase